MGRLTSWRLGWRLWLGLGVGISINVLDRTSYVVEITLGYWCFNGFVALVNLFSLAVVVVEHSALEVDRGGIESNGGAFGGEAIHNGPKLLHLHRSHPNTWGSLPSAFEIVVAWSLQGQIAFFTCRGVAHRFEGGKQAANLYSWCSSLIFLFYWYVCTLMHAPVHATYVSLSICNVLKLKIAQDKC